MPKLTNFTFDEIQIGQSATYSKTLDDTAVRTFAAVSGDINPVHLDDEFAATTMFGGRIGHGMWTGALVSAALAVELPGPGTIYLSQSLSFRAPVKLGDVITVTLEVSAKDEIKRRVTLACTARNQKDKTVATGEAVVIAPDEKLTLDVAPAPQVKLV